MTEVGTYIPVEDGMVINIGTPFCVLGRGAYQVERTFVIGKKVSEITPKGVTDRASISSLQPPSRGLCVIRLPSH